MTALRLCLAIVFIALAPLAWAQSLTAEQYRAWSDTAERAEEAIAAGRASNAALEQLRTDLVGWREDFDEGQNVNAAQIRTVQSRLSALGPPPPDGETEPDEVAERRAELTEQLSALRAPRVQAEDAFSRADSLIFEIDRVIRERQTDALMELGPSPLNPALWGTALTSLGTSLRDVGEEVVATYGTSVQRREFRENLPTILLYLVLAMLALFRGWHWLDRLQQWLDRRKSPARQRVTHYAISLGQAVIPFLGLVLLVEAFFDSGLVGLRGNVILDIVPVAGAVYLAARWLGRLTFPRRVEVEGLLDVPVEMRRAGRFYVQLAGGIFFVQALLVSLAEFENWSDATRSIVAFPFLLALGFALTRLGRFIRIASTRDASAGSDDPQPYRNRVLGLLGRAIILVGIVGPVLGAIGYTQAARFLVYPSLLSLGLLVLIVVVQDMISQLYAIVTRRREVPSDSLTPVLIGLCVTIAALPLLALIWGARVADLTELWTQFQNGIRIGETRISPSNFLAFALIFSAGYAATRLIQGTLRNSVLPKTRLDLGGQNAVVSGLGYVGIFLAALIAITATGIDLSSLAIVAGALSVGIGFGLQNIVSNFVSGIILLIERPISEGDWIEVGGQMGIVRDISVRSTRIETFDRTDVIVPNADLVSGMVTNWTHGNSVGRVIVPVGVAYGTDTKWIDSILMEIAKAHPMVLANPAPAVIFQGFGADSLDFEIRAILRDVNWVLSVKSDLNHAIAKRFAEEGIEIPFAQRDLWLRNPETLKGGTSDD
ncbi:DUF3772 domain-containing protein [Cognatishimia sp. MH4019]|uniref:DUF3772 domain-containing protein n=1 Tax=Cognatishimia sp. MH4019 TaxID=2854030 RepID=UPI001CD6C743|nr:DUF3772 domain-containing protein [Cognatishimia sp. MH4019]